MPRLKLTDTAVRKLPAPTHTKKVFYSDSEVPRLFVQVTRDGAKSFVLRYSFKKRERLFTIGRWPTWPCGAAREEAKGLLRDIDRGDDKGVDPLAQRIAAREAPTVRALAARYITDHLPTKRPASASADIKTLDKIILPAIGTRKVADIGRADIAALHRKITERGSPVRANRVRALLSKMFSLAVELEMRTTNPCKGVKLNPETGRKRYLDGGELARLSKALAEYPNQAAANAIRLQLLTGARPGEVLGATWTQFDLPGRVWVKPASTTKQKSEHVVFLSAPAQVLLTEMLETARSEWLFPDRSASGHLTQLRYAWTQISKAAAFDPPVRRHDLRHSFASILMSSGRSLELIGSLLGHTKIATTQRYSHLHDSAARAAIEEVGQIVTDSREMAELHELRRRG